MASGPALNRLDTAASNKQAAPLYGVLFDEFIASRSAPNRHAPDDLILDIDDAHMLLLRQKLSTDHFALQQTTATQRGASTLALNPDNHHAYLINAELDEIDATAAEQRPRRLMLPGSFVLLVMGES